MSFDEPNTVPLVCDTSVGRYKKMQTTLSNAEGKA